MPLWLLLWSKLVIFPTFNSFSMTTLLMNIFYNIFLYHDPNGSFSQMICQCQTTSCHQCYHRQRIWIEYQNHWTYQLTIFSVWWSRTNTLSFFDKSNKLAVVSASSLAVDVALIIPGGVAGNQCIFLYLFQFHSFRQKIYWTIQLNFFPMYSFIFPKRLFAMPYVCLPHL